MLLLLGFDRTIDMVDKTETAHEANKSKHHEESVGDDARVTEIERQLQCSTHITAMCMQ